MPVSKPDTRGHFVLPMMLHVAGLRLKVEGHGPLLYPGFQLATCFVCGVYQTAVNLVSINLIVALQAVSFSCFVLPSLCPFPAHYLNNYILVEGLLARVKTFSAGA